MSISLYGSYKNFNGIKLSRVVSEILIPTTAIKGVWTFDGSVSPSVGSHTSTLYNNAAISSAKKVWNSYTSSLYTGSGTSDTGVILSTKNVWATPTKYTIEFWYQHISYNSTGALFTFGNRQDNYAMQLKVSSSNHIMFAPYYAPTLTDTNMVVSTSSWNWFVLSWDTNKWEFFKDGVKTGSLSTTSQNADGVILAIGDYDTGYNTHPRYPITGYIQDLAIYSDAPYSGKDSINVPKVPILSRVVA